MWSAQVYAGHFLQLQNDQKLVHVNSNPFGNDILNAKIDFGPDGFVASEDGLNLKPDLNTLRQC